mmetsp:Transcript_16495/g.29820  ORF Transcript_16495/g.29820 Transcript_16495/m.29820 type:complete len:213 (-) Transcript_16495:125-763(-)
MCHSVITIQLQRCNPRQNLTKNIRHIPTPLIPKTPLLLPHGARQHQLLQSIPHTPKRKSSSCQCTSRLVHSAPGQNLQSQRRLEHGGMTRHAELGVNVKIVIGTGAHQRARDAVGNIRTQVDRVGSPSSFVPRGYPFFLNSCKVSRCGVGREFIVGGVTCGQGSSDQSGRPCDITCGGRRLHGTKGDSAIAIAAVVVVFHRCRKDEITRNSC